MGPAVLECQLVCAARMIYMHCRPTQHVPQTQIAPTDKHMLLCRYQPSAPIRPRGRQPVRATAMHLRRLPVGQHVMDP
jgi:hypothetical protein